MSLVIALGIIGLCFVIGWAATYGSRPYLGLIGLAFIAGAAIRLIPARQAPARYAVIALCILLFLAAAVAAIRQVRRGLAQMRAESAAREQAFFEVFQAAEGKRQSQDESPPQEPSPQETGDEGRES